MQYKASKHDLLLLSQISDRYLKRFSKSGKKIDVMMDLEAVISNGCPLRLADLLAANDFNFFHEVCGIRENLNRETGALQNFFLPRFALHNQTVEERVLSHE